MQFIKSLTLTNFKKFKDFEVEFSHETNTIIGDNEAGKSTLLQAIELVASGSRNRVETLGIESLLNKKAVSDFFSAETLFENLPEIHIELELNDGSNPDLVGKHNSKKTNLSGLHLICQPNEDLTSEIQQVLSEDGENFPFEYYVAKFITFSGEAFSGYRRYLKCLTIDSSQINSDYANKEYTKSVYDSTVNQKTRIRLKNEYRQQKTSFKDNNLKAVNDELGEYAFTVRSGSKYNLETDLALTQDEIPVDERGKGQQCFIKTEFALSRNSEKREIDTLLLEEPENHLSHSNMKRLINKISESHQNQIIIATHSSMISTRLDLRNSILLNSSSDAHLKLKDLTKSTAKFFMKAPDNNILEFVLAKKVILVEGDAEYIIFEALYELETGRTLDHDSVHVISVGGTSFKRYMELANYLIIRTAVIRDNDKNYQLKCVDNYVEHINNDIAIFSENDNERYTFEVCIYEDNLDICNELFSGGNIKKTPLEFMLDNKAEASLRLLEAVQSRLKAGDANLTIPDYIKRAVAWINE